MPEDPTSGGTSGEPAAAPSGGGWRLVESERALPALGWPGASGAGAPVPAASAGEEGGAVVAREPEGEVKCIVFSADGSRLAAGSEVRGGVVRGSGLMVKGLRCGV